MLQPPVETRRLVMTPVSADTLTELLVVYETNPAYIELTEGANGYDRDRLQRDWHVASITPGRHMWGIYRKEDAAPVGVVDFLERNPNDGYPWLGLLMIRGDCHGQGYGTEALEALLRHFRDRFGWEALRIGVASGNDAAFNWWQKRGFQVYGRVTRRLPGGEREIICLERKL